MFLLRLLENRHTHTRMHKCRTQVQNIHTRSQMHALKRHVLMRTSRTYTILQACPPPGLASASTHLVSGTTEPHGCMLGPHAHPAQPSLPWSALLTCALPQPPLPPRHWLYVLDGALPSAARTMRQHARTHALTHTHMLTLTRTCSHHLLLSPSPPPSLPHLSPTPSRSHHLPGPDPPVRAPRHALDQRPAGQAHELGAAGLPGG